MQVSQGLVAFDICNITHRGANQGNILRRLLDTLPEQRQKEADLKWPQIVTAKDVELIYEFVLIAALQWLLCSSS